MQSYSDWDGMAELVNDADGTVEPGAATEWHWNPALPLPVSPIFDWPPRPLGVLLWISGYWFAVSSTVIELLLAIGVYLVTQPALDSMQELGGPWVATIWLRNLALLCLVAGGLHLCLYRIGTQGRELKNDPRDFSVGNRVFWFRNQVRDNVFWSLASGVTVWTGFEVLFFWAAANGAAPLISFAQAPVYSVLWLLLIPIWASFHFYWIHRALHWPPLYRLAHNLHHRNINIGPWSGLSMHPLEHVLYFSSVLIHFVVPSDPVHVMFHLYNLALNPAVSHSGFEALLLRRKRRMALGDFFHQLHHRYFECNYGTAEVPWDAVFGSFHNGTREATARTRARKKLLGR